MLDRVLPIALGEVHERRETRNLADTIRAHLQRVLRLLSRLIEAGGPMS
jgi:hypothetical protein